MSRRSELPDEMLMDEAETPEKPYSESPWEGREPSDFSEDAFSLLYALAMTVWQRDVVVACRKRDYALVLAKRDDDGRWAMKAGSDSRWWLVENPWPEDNGMATYSIVMELDAPRDPDTPTEGES